MNAGAYRHRVVIEKRSVVTDEIGNQSSGWEKYFSGYAYINNLSGAEYWQAAQTQSENTVMFVMRYHPLLNVLDTVSYRLFWRDKEYNIISIDNVQYKNETVKIRATAKE